MPDNPSSAPKRCAIYKRKSTTSRLEHAVNSLTTQHEMCSAYVASQRYRGWTELARRYDGGHSEAGSSGPRAPPRHPAQPVRARHVAVPYAPPSEPNTQ